MRWRGLNTPAGSKPCEGDRFDPPRSDQFCHYCLLDDAISGVFVDEGR